jgi:HSP20 family protein
MADKQELQVQQKREADKDRESTIPTRAYMPTADIFETEDALTVVLEMPGVSKDNVDVSVENGVLTIEGRIDFQKYEGLQPVYGEYNIGPIGGASGFPAKSIKTRLRLRCGTASLH